MDRRDFTLVHSLRVRWAEVDRQGVVFNPHYFAYFDVAVTEYWRAIDYPYPGAMLEAGTDVFAVKATAGFHGSAAYDDVLDIGCRVARLGRSSMQYLLGIWRGDEHLTSGELVYVHVHLATRKPVPLPEPLRAAILRFERTPPAAEDGRGSLTGRR
ncbi:MAG TPA: thioesterase family protein [Myxococcales bacterium]|nr:thioesterase family protein [Myxococcales bacterium]